MIWQYPEAEKTPDFKMTGQQLAGFDAQLLSERPVITIENPFDQDDPLDKILDCCWLCFLQRGLAVLRA